MRTKFPVTRTIIRRDGISALLFLVFLASGINNSSAQGPAYGNLYQQEYGDVVYRKLNNALLGLFGLNYNHTGVFAGMNASDAQKVMQAAGEGGSTTGDTTVEVDMSDYNFSPQGLPYYGAFTKSDVNLSFSARRSIVATGVSIVDANIPYVVFDAINFSGAGRNVASNTEIRCDAVVEYCYEANGWIVWWPAANSSRWSILTYPGDHNDAPDLTVNPDTEFSPWSQRGAPTSSGVGPGYSGANPNNTYLTRAAVINLPTYQVTQVAANSYVDVTVRATDESGIHYIAYKKPGDTAWSWSPIQAQHPTSDSYTFGPIRITSSGTSYTYAMDNGGNSPLPANAQAYTITVSSVSVPTVQTLSAADLSPTSARLRGQVTSTGGSSTLERRFEWAKSSGNWGTGTSGVDYGMV